MLSVVVVVAFFCFFFNHTLIDFNLTGADGDHEHPASDFLVNSCVMAQYPDRQYPGQSYL